MGGKIIFVAATLAIFLCLAAFAFFSPDSLSRLSFLRNGPSPVPAFAASANSSGDLAIPYVDPSALAIDATGASTVSAYIDYFINHVQGISFDNSRFASVLKSKDGVMLLPPELADKALVSSNFQEVHSSLVVAKNFLDAKIAFEKTIKVTGDAVPLSQEMVGFDRLTETLIQNILNVEAGTMSKSDLQSYLTQYYRTASHEHAKISNQAMGMENDHSLWGQFLKQLGLIPTARAQMPPFGGLITNIEWCVCNVGWVVDVSPPVPVRLFVPVAFLSSPLFYEYHQMSVGTWWLGLHTTTYIPCLIPTGLGCDDIGGGLLIYMTGTSGGGGGLPVPPPPPPPPACGDGVCNVGETTASCPADCTGTCGNGTCDVGETSASCPADCLSGTGTCAPVTSGPCSVANLSKTCFAGNAAQASAVCNVESNGNPRIGSGVDKTVDGRPVSWGLFQVNKTVNDVNGLGCPNAFSGPYTGASSRVTVVDEGLYNQCVAANQDPSTNINEACALSTGGSNWGPWKTTARKCGFLP